MTATETATALECPRCGTPVAAGQEYCLECGLRLPETHPRQGWPADAGAAEGWVWPVLVALVVAALSAGAVVAVRLTKDDVEPLLVATTATPPTPPLTETAREAPPATSPPPTTAPPPTTTPPPPTTGRLVQWPAGSDGYTVILASVPEPSGRARATATAREASDAGLAEVGVLRSSRFGSLHPGYFVVFSGIYDTFGEAEQGITTARRAGYDKAYVRPIAS
jgi:hypothetical protein